MPRPRPRPLRQCRHLQTFFEATGFWKLSPHDELKRSQTKYVLADPGRSYIAYGDQIARAAAAGASDSEIQDMQEASSSAFPAIVAFGSYNANCIVISDFFCRSRLPGDHNCLTVQYFRRDMSEAVTLAIEALEARRASYRYIRSGR